MDTETDTKIATFYLENKNKTKEEVKKKTESLLMSSFIRIFHNVLRFKENNYKKEFLIQIKDINVVYLMIKYCTNFGVQKANLGSKLLSLLIAILASFGNDCLLIFRGTKRVGFPKETRII